MRIAQVSPLIESVPPRGYGGIERVVHYLTEELVARGHDVTLFASGDSKTSADHVAVVRESLRNSPGQPDPLIWHTLQMAEVARLADKFDVVHFHTDIIQYPVWRHIATPQVTTLHGRLNIPGFDALFREFDDMPVISISDSQRTPLPNAHWVSTVYNGIPDDLYDFCPSPGDYFAFLGRMSAEKGPERAIEIARRTGTPLKMAAKVDVVDRDYFDEQIRPLLEDPLIEFVGEVNEAEKNELLGGAKALLFPINWPEPFGLVMIEAMACGTPVIASACGSVPEVMQDGVSGYIVETVDEAVEAVGRLERIDRRACRDYFQRRFSARAMADGYERIYRELSEHRQPASAGGFPRWERPTATSRPGAMRLPAPHVAGNGVAKPVAPVSAAFASQPIRHGRPLL